MLAAKVMPTGRSPKRRGPPGRRDHHADRGAARRPGPLAVLGLTPAAHQPDADRDREHGDHDPRGEPRDIGQRRSGAVADRDRGLLQRGADRRQQPDAGGGGADGEAQQHHPGADGAFSHPVPGAARAPAREDHANAEEQAAHDVGHPAQGAQGNIHQPQRVDRLHADHRDQQGEEVGAQDVAVPHEDGVRESAGETEAAALDDVPEDGRRWRERRPRASRATRPWPAMLAKSPMSVKVS